MGVYKLSTAGGLATPRTNYSSFLAGNPAVVFTSYESIATVTVGSGGAANVEFTSIPATYTHLQIRGFARTSRATFGVEGLRYQLNADTGSNYSWHHLRGDGSTTEASAGASISYMESQRILGTTTGASFGAQIMDILDYKDTNKYTTVRVFGGVDVNGTVNATGGAVMITSGNWRNTNAVTSIKLFGDSANFAEYSQFALYGIKGA
jgi:hypothetical protein